MKNTQTITIPQRSIQRSKGVVVLPIREYQKLCEQIVPTFYLKGKKAQELDRLVESGINAYRKGKCKAIRSLADIDS
ncbi:MAG: hypothetical protein HYW78_03935 [Parcubacteria group bacterium]|nr:hypothetical protein [Parcubacteria group bacterium]